MTNSFAKISKNQLPKSSSTSMDQSPADISNIVVPTFCEYYEPLLVEEIVLLQPHSMHYGKCAVIGYLHRSEPFLESLAIPGLPEELQLPDGITRVRLDFDTYYGEVPRDCTVRIFGYAQLKGPASSPANSSKDLACSLVQLRDELRKQGVVGRDIETKLQHSIIAMANDYQPVLIVHGVERVDRAKELISCNLRLKEINKRMKPLLHEISTSDQR